MENINKILERINSQKQQEYNRGDIYYIEKAYTTGAEQQAGRPAEERRGMEMRINRDGLLNP